MTEDEYLTVEEVAKALRIKPFTVRDWLRKRELPSYKFGREYRIKKTDFDQFVKKARLEKKDP